MGQYSMHTSVLGAILFSKELLPKFSVYVCMIYIRNVPQRVLVCRWAVHTSWKSVTHAFRRHQWRVLGADKDEDVSSSLMMMRREVRSRDDAKIGSMCVCSLHPSVEFSYCVCMIVGLSTRVCAHIIVCVYLG